MKYFAKNQYQFLRKQLLDIGSKIRQAVIKNKRPIHDLCKYEEHLRSIYSELEQILVNKEENPDWFFVSHNFYSNLSYIELAKSNSLSSLICFLKAVKYLILHSKNVNNLKSLINSLKYYEVLSNYIVNSNPNIFANKLALEFTTISKDVELLIKELSTDLKYNGFVKKLTKLLISLNSGVVQSLLGAYTEEHLNILDQLSKILENLVAFLAEDDFFERGRIRNAQYILLKKKLHFLIRPLVPDSIRRIPEEERDKLKSKIRQNIENMKKLSSQAKKHYKKCNREDEKVNFYRLNSIIDNLACDYYYALYVEEDIVNCLKRLEKIFNQIRRHWKIIQTPKLFIHFADEFIMLSSYLKLIILGNEFLSIGKRFEQIEPKNWKTKIFRHVGEKLLEISSTVFKYKHEKILENKELIISEKGATGKFIEFVIFYVIRELIEKQINFAGLIKNIQDSSIREIFTILNQVEDKNLIKWDYPLEYNEEKTDVDIYIEGKAAIFIKSGILQSSDLKKIKREISIATNSNIPKIFIVIDIPKNQIINNLKPIYEENQYVEFSDLGLFLRELLNIAKGKIQLNLERHTILNWSGFYSL